MRISTQHIFNLASTNMANANKEIYKTNEEISTGIRIRSAADDPVAAIRINSLNNYLDTIDQYQKNVIAAENSLALKEITLNSSMNILQRIEELAVQAGNTAVLSAAEYDDIAAEISNRTDELLSLMNTQDPNGTYIFSGYQSETPAFSGNLVNGFEFEGDEGQTSVRVDTNTYVDISDSGKTLFVDVPSSQNTARATVPETNRSNPAIEMTTPMVVDQEAYDEFYPEDMVIRFNEDSNITPAAKNFTITERSTGKVLLADQPYVSGGEVIVGGLSFEMSGTPVSSNTGQNNGDQVFIDSSDTQDTMVTIQKFYNALKTYDGSSDMRESLEQAIGDTITNISNAQENINQALTSIGARNNTLESVKNLHADTKLVTQEVLSDLRDTDYAEATTRLSAQTFVLQATQASFLTIRDLNLISQI